MLRLRPYVRSDAESVVKWFPDEFAMHQWCADGFSSFPLQPEEINAQYEARQNLYPMTAFDESGVVGHMFMCFTDPEKRILRLGYVVLDDRLRGKGYGREMILLAAKYAFEILKAEKITLGVFSNNPRAQRCYQSAGFALLPEEKWKSYRVMNEDWECREMELTRK